MLGTRIKKLILVRLFFAALFLYCPKVFSEGAGFAFYGVAAAIALLSAAYLLWYLVRRWLWWLACVQIAADLALETFLVSFTGGAESLFGVFYVLSILSTALVLGEKKLIIQVTIASCLLYFGASLGVYLKGQNPFVVQDPIYFSYGTAVRIATFLIVGHLSRFLSGTVLELQNRLQLSERLSFLGEVISKVSHEIRNPLSAIRTASEVLEDSLKGKISPTDEKMLAVIGGESDRLTKTLQRILNYARQGLPSPKMLLLDGLVERTLAVIRLHSQVQSKDVTVEKEYDTNKTHVYADEEQILAALLNLTLNTCEALPQGGVLKIGAVEELRGTWIDLQDNGGGIPKEKMRDLFTPFKTTKKGGTGLGLAEVHKIITLHEGKIEVQSKTGKGTTFRLYFPKP